jgi:Bacterial Ig-like domain
MARPARRARREAQGTRVRLSARSACAAVAVVLAAACANTGDPPGGPPDEKPPVILSVYPESGAVLPGLRHDAVIQFDGVIEEQSGGSSLGGGSAGGLAARVLLSPTRGPVKVSWHRSSIHVKPKEGWQPGRVYRLQLLPGITDLRHNVMKTGRLVMFSTGPALPHGSLAGLAVQWVEQRPLVGGLIQAVLTPDTIAYLALTDSSGGYRLDGLPPGRYVVYAVADQNGNRLRDRREAYDSATVTLDSAATAVLWTFAHDTIGPRLRDAEPYDSISARLTFSEALDPRWPLDSLQVRAVLLPDSTPVGVAGLFRQARYDSLLARERAAAETARAGPDTTPRDTTPRDTTSRRPTPPADTSSIRLVLQQRPVPFDKLVVRFDTLLAPGEKYVVEVRGARNLNGARADGHAVLVVPKPKPPSPPAPSPQRPDSGAARRDSTPR